MLHLVIAAALLTQSPQQFDLVCTGEMRSGSRLGGFETSPYNERLRIDLQTNRWCAGECTTPKTIQSSSPAEIVLASENTPDMQQEFRVNRTTGSVQHTIVTGPISLRAYGQCTRADFSGMPTAAF